ncbi:TIGR03086 family metal-binding protein [Goodfellowiella coeruleoviolacea]|uniref:TIGR03086 family protein n=1 Tax=Goodfellowiella coeruleoviolacea TaxID=334858 RepID=A0AAE3G8T4_9PSEU|nr:TIGR03086 family metal-binding protein [Goodfellowiella coeruleoviolacea]MCP2163816.1 TIGR03086 family protein [Goodfellowiella coeruleoviolacea]
MVDLLEAHGRALAEFDARVRQVRPDQWEQATPCTEWSVRDLVGHLVYEQLWVPALLAGQTTAEVGDRYEGDQLGADPVDAWDRAAAAARAAWTEPGVLERRVHLSYGRVPAEQYGWEMTTDLTVHAWDLARAVGADERLDPDLAAAVLSRTEPQVEAWRSAGIFGPRVPVPAEAPAQDRLLGLLGRQP